MLNTLQIIVLSVDSLINLVGGVKSLVSESCNVGGVKKGRTVRKEEVRHQNHFMYNYMYSEAKHNL